MQLFAQEKAITGLQEGDLLFQDLNCGEFDVFMVTYSDVEILEYGDFILDIKNLNTTIEVIEKYLNNPNLNLSYVFKFTYKIKDIRNRNTWKYKKNEEFIEHVHLFLQFHQNNYL
jgi:hypothetical protein